MTNAQPDRSSQSQFGRLAGAYGASKTHSQAGALASAASMLSDRRYGTAMDIGAGPGFTAFAVADHCDRVIATDVAPEMLEQARSLRGERGAPQTELMLTAAESLPCLDGSLNLITCRTAAHHFLNVDAWLTEVHRALASGGELILIDTISPDDAEAEIWMHSIEIWRDPSHVRNPTEAEWLSAIERAGLRVVETALSRVNLEYPDWTERAGMPEEEAARLGQALRNAPPAAAEAFGITLQTDGTIEFYWPILSVKAVKP